ncbi:MAG: polymerase sigma-54 factor RpoN [Candidatus Angelobacter sp.]|nr:polymerase sigma-54 factor RpoN [Candidatus Angelobacter sp.]
MLQQTLEETNAPCTPGELDRVPERRSFADPDALLVEALKARNAAAFDDLEEQFGRRLLNVAMKITKNREDAEDVVQEAFLKVFKNIDGFRACSKFATWLTRIAINQALMMIRGNRQKFVSIDEGTEIENRFACLATAASGYTPEQLCSQHEFEDVLLNLTNVREFSRRVMELHLNDGLSEVEISQVLSLSLSAVKGRLHRGRLDLREAISRRFRSTKLAQACKKMFPTSTRRTNTPVDLLSKAHLVHYNANQEQRP